MYVMKVGLCGGGRGSETQVLGVPPLPLRIGGALRVTPSALRSKPERCGELGAVEERLGGLNAPASPGSPGPRSGAGGHECVSPCVRARGQEGRCSYGAECPGGGLVRGCGGRESRSFLGE